MTRDELIKHLQSIVDAKQRQYNKRFSSLAMNEIHELITTGVDRMSIAQRNNASDIALAEHNLVLIISACYDRSYQRRENEVSRDTFVTVRMMDCPKWPYC